MAVKHLSNQVHIRIKYYKYAHYNSTVVRECMFILYTGGHQPLPAQSTSFILMITLKSRYETKKALWTVAIAHLRTQEIHTRLQFFYFSRKWEKNSQLRSRYLDSLTACKFSSHSSEHRRRSYELCILTQISMHGMQNNHVIPLFPWIIEVSYTLSRSREARCCTSQLLSISEAYCARLSPKGRTGTLRKWLYSIGCP